MLAKVVQCKVAVVSLLAAWLWLGVGSQAPAWAQSCHGGGGGHAGHAGPSQHSRSEHADRGQVQSQAAGVSIVERPPHGGQVSTDEVYFFEVVYQPRETHVYLYGPAQEPLPAGNVRGEVVMQPDYAERSFRFPLKFAPLPDSSAPQNRLAVGVDVSGVPDGKMKVSFHLENLPFRRQPKAAFAQTFALAKARPQVTVAMLTADDPPRIERQRVCPVAGAKLGSMGTPIKLLVGQQPVYLCCKGCVGKVEENPWAYLPAAPATPAQRADGAPPGQFLVSQATAQDDAEIRAQGVCPVMNTQLGEHGAPIKITVGGQSLFVCCRGCIGKVQQAPERYLALSAQLRAIR